MFTFGNVGTTETPRYAAHLILCWLLTCERAIRLVDGFELKLIYVLRSRTVYVFYLIKREFAAWIILRQDFLISKDHSRLAQSKTVLVTGVPKEFLTVESMTKFCSVLPGGVKRIWLAR